MTQLYETAKREIKYNASYFLQLIREQGGVAAAKTLVNKKTISEGYGFLVEQGRLDLTIEALVVQEPWRALFSDDELKRANRRLPDSLRVRPRGER